MAGVSSKLIADKMMNKHNQILGKDALLAWIRKRASDINENGLLILAGAGDIDQLAEPISKILSRTD